jgi:hypothetical protein
MGPPPSVGIKSTMPCWASVLVRVSLLGNKILTRYVKCSVSYHGHVLECRVLVITQPTARGRAAQKGWGNVMDQSTKGHGPMCYTKPITVAHLM